MAICRLAWTAVREEALLLTIGGLPGECGHLAKLLDFFGVPSRTLTAEEFLASHRARTEGGPKPRLFCSSDTLSRVVGGQDGRYDGIGLWQEHVHSAFVYAGNDSGLFQKLAGRLAGDKTTTLNKSCRYHGDLVVLD